MLPRDGAHQLDWSLAAYSGDYALATDGGVGLCSGHDRMMGRLLRAVMSEQGSYMFDLTWGSRVFPNHTIPESIAVELMSVARAQVRAFQLLAPVPGEVMSQVQVTAVSPTGDPRVWEANVIVWDQIGGNSQSVVTLVR